MYFKFINITNIRRSPDNVDTNNKFEFRHQNGSVILSLRDFQLRITEERSTLTNIFRKGSITKLLVHFSSALPTRAVAVYVRLHV